ncbi:DUF4423 domain-containing protein [Peredibacter sp. HCB2-198]|uniref:DUF4423 domain-containing protein n=1 Tax=Peredibacter sp. HCB2-198 TaxID=3383025 RepID=UPI0038B66A59
MFGTQRTYLERSPPLLEKHHSNWRLRALNQFDSLSEEEMMFTSPMSISKKDFVKLREMLAEFIEKSSQIIRESPAKKVACLNIDFFWVK